MTVSWDDQSSRFVLHNGTLGSLHYWLTVWLLDEGGDDVGEGGRQAHGDTPVEGDGHDAVHDEDDEDEVPAQQERVIDQVIGLHKPNFVTSTFIIFSLVHLIAALQSEQEPGAGRSPVEVVIGVTSANKVTLNSKLTFHCVCIAFK